MRTPTPHIAFPRSCVFLASLVALAACGPTGAPDTRRAIRSEDMPRVKELLEQDRHQHRNGVRNAARLLRRGFGVEDAATRERQMRTALRRIQQPSVRGTVAEFVSSPMSFLAAIDETGVVIARDAQNDQMRGENFGERFEVVQAALQDGTNGRMLGEFPAIDDEGNAAEGESSWAMLFAAPVDHQGERVGAVLAGIPLWREAQRLSNQLRVDRASQIQEGLIVWVYMYRGDQVFYGPDTPPEVTEMVPDHGVRTNGLTRSPGGFTGDLQLHGRWYGYAVVPTPSIGDDVGIIVMRSDPQ